MIRLSGRQPVLERLRRAPKSIRTLYLRQGTEAKDLLEEAHRAGCRIVTIPSSQFARLAGEAHAQGVVAEVEGFSYAALEDLLEGKEKRTLFFLDRITDPQNLGSILRSLACFGKMAVVLPKHESVEVTDTVLRVACGGENEVPVSQVTNLVQSCELAKKAGYWIAGAVASGGEPIQKVAWPDAVGVVLGSEGSGIRPGLAKHLDFSVTLPMPGAPLSFNVAIAAALVAYEVTRSRL